MESSDPLRTLPSGFPMCTVTELPLVFTHHQFQMILTSENARDAAGMEILASDTTHRNVPAQRCRSKGSGCCLGIFFSLFFLTKNKQIELFPRKASVKIFQIFSLSLETAFRWGNSAPYQKKFHQPNKTKKNHQTSQPKRSIDFPLKKPSVSN